MSEVTDEKPKKKKVKLFGQHPTKQSRLFPERRVSEHEGTVFRAVYHDKGSVKRPTFHGRIVDFQPVMEGDKVVGVVLSYRPGIFNNGSWEEEHVIETRTLGPFESISRTVAEVKIPTKKGGPIIEEFEITTWALMGSPRERPCRELTFSLMSSI